MRRVIAISLMLAASLTACSTSVSSLALHELPAKEAPQWDLVSVKGLNEHLTEIYETGTVISKGGRVAVRGLSNVDYEDFLKPRGTLRISGKGKFDTEDIVYISFKTCTANQLSFMRVDGVLKAKDFYNYEVACWSRYGPEEVYLSTQRFFDPFVWSVLRKVTNYRVSHDGQTLTLLGAQSEQLGLFKRQEATK